MEIERYLPLPVEALSRSAAVIAWDVVRAVTLSNIILAMLRGSPLAAVPWVSETPVVAWMSGS